MNLVETFLGEGFLLSPDFIKNFGDHDFTWFFKNIKNKIKEKENLLVLNEDLFFLIKGGGKELSVNWLEFEKSKVFLERQKNNNSYNLFLDVLSCNLGDKKCKIIEEVFSDGSELIEEKKEKDNSVIVIKSYNNDVKKIEVQDFVGYFRVRYSSLKKILINRLELKDTISIGRIVNKESRERVAVIGIVNDKRITKGGNIILDIEDFTGKLRVILKNTDKELFDLAQDIVLDEVVGITGVNNKEVVFADNIIYPDIPLDNVFKKLDREEYAVFTSDLHVGSKLFLEKDFLKFVKWLNGEGGDKKQKEIANKVKYLFIVGDLIEGVGIYPGQFDDLEITDVYKQFEKFVELLSLIRKDINIIICGGNHDALRLAEPQPVLDKKIAKGVYEMENVLIVTNPCIVNIASSFDFPGFNVLMYHGYSFPYLADNVESIRKSGRLERADLIMKFLLQRRHLAPTHTSIQYIPNVEEDPLIIDIVPDFFVSGHIHRVCALNYRNVTVLGCGCWSEESDDQRKRGLVPDPSKVILVNLQKRDVKILNFKE
ncbi:MAG: metallophosphoesterase [Nanoarchaeota archaeon]|nr:metallophosphoesterase [Nanoarchaeota archaeon]